ncbi:hypothetical protein [Rhodopseudomonas palustris]|uniref:hypothetical protein n=1 Tax=Rhodopseudomonas palustris TaxID=1076 RepID=UPI0012D4180D|nr:hypothetical protein [Rhodopseudomonas palustris]
MSKSFDISETVEWPWDVNEAIVSYLDCFGYEVLDFEIYQNERGERCVAVALQSDSVIRGGIMLITPNPQAGTNKYSIVGMYEDEGPLATFCPQRILDILSPTDSYAARYWREMCQERLLVESGDLAPLPSFVIVDGSRDAPGYCMPEDNGSEDMDDFDRGTNWNDPSLWRPSPRVRPGDDPPSPRF